MRKILLAVSFFLSTPLAAQGWTPDLGNGRFKNPVLFADYSDPDITRVGDDFYLVSSSFNAVPGIPVLHSKDLVNWEIIGHVYDRLPFERYDKPQHGEGSWAPSIRFHDGLFYVFFPTPHEGLFVATAKDPAGRWDVHQVTAVEMWEDPCPLWDDDGNAYLVRGKLQAGALYLHRMSPDGRRLLDNGTVIFKDTVAQPTIEGPKFLKKDGYYYIFAPAGGGGTGWQAVLRSRSVYGPYESHNVLHQGRSDVNGPHQGGIVQLASGEWWFAHFQQRGAYGRVVHLQPVVWKDGWPVMGEDADGDGVGDPVKEFTKPNVGRSYPISNPQTSDEFNAATFGLQWQWHANPKPAWYSMSAHPGQLRLNAVQTISQNGNLWFVPNLLLQKFSAPAFTATTKVSFHPQLIDEKSGLVVMGEQWAFVALTKTVNGIRVGMYTGTYNRRDDATRLVGWADLTNGECYLRVSIAEGGVATFSYGTDGQTFVPLGEPFQSKPGTWIGAKVGLFYVNPNIAMSSGYADYDWFRMK